MAASRAHLLRQRALNALRLVGIGILAKAAVFPIILPLSNLLPNVTMDGIGTTTISSAALTLRQPPRPLNHLVTTASVFSRPAILAFALRERRLAPSPEPMV